MTSSPTSSVGVALLGYGLGGAVFHGPLIASIAGLTLDTIVTRDPARQAQARRDHPNARIVATTEEVWEGGRPPALVAISTPNRTHVPLALQAIAHGAHVVVDKPMALTATEGRLLALAATRAQRLVIPFQNRRWDGDFQTVRALLANDSLGAVHRFESRFERWRAEPKGGWREVGGKEEGGGLLYDIGSHLIDQALVLFGPAKHVYAELDQRRAGVNADDDAFVALTHTSGVRSHLWATVVAAQGLPRFRVLGARSAYTKWGLDVQEGALRTGLRPGNDTWGVEERDHWGSLGTDGAVEPVETARGNYLAFYEGVLTAMRGDSAPPVLIEEAIATLTIIECAQESSARGVVVNVVNVAAT
ncbi:MAG: Gfo/Idh/MocA family oxidoreductase [Gemmatimonadaceae bacterium]